ncbi:MAG: endonuclease/exonuclease/phosphatase family protein [Anaerolineaceae bacterium]|nr:endonuclease/exonuclease/phosphatase family protein [Anaerolineaceae bacterium]
MKNTSSLFLFLYAVMFLAFFHLLTGLVEATYTFGLLGTSIPPEIIYVLFLLTPLLLLFSPRILEGKKGRIFTLAAGLLSLVCWSAVLCLDTGGRMIAGGIGTGSILLFFPGIVKQKPSCQPALSLGGGLAFAILTAILLRQHNFGTGLLPIGTNFFVIIGVILVGILELLDWFRAAPDPSPQPSSQPLSFPQTASLFIGLASVMILLFFSFSNPAVIARWTGSEYLFVIGLTTAPIAICLIWLFAPFIPSHNLPRPLLIIWNALFIISLVGTILPYQIVFPLDPSAYPLAEPAAGPFATGILILMLLLHPILYIDAALFFNKLSDGSVPSSGLAGGMAVFAIYQLLLIFAHVFTTVYDYIPVVGPLFRDMFWLVYFVPGAFLFLTVLFQQGSLTWRPHPAYQRWPLFSAVGLALLTIGVVIRVSLWPISDPGREKLRIMTYNLQQGYSRSGQKNFSGQFALIRDRQPDILGLQETDTARIAGGNSDLVRYLATNLHMYSYYGAKTVTGTFGIALLSRYPIENPRTYFLYSSGEQTAVIEAQIHAGDQTYTIMVTHLGNGGPIIQQQQILQLTPRKSNLLLMGDFNFSPSTEQYRQTVSLFQDGWLAAVEKNTALPNQKLEKRIDHIFLSSGLKVLSAEYIGEGPSDHPAMLINVQLFP